MKAVIVEDEQLAADRLANLIKQTASIDVVGQFDTVRDTVSFFEKQENQIDLMFCDIQLADGLSFKIFEKIDVNIPVIFTTAYDEYSLQAFKVNSLDYLLKPVQYADLEAAIKKYTSIYAERKNPFDPSVLQELFLKKKFKERFLVKLGSKYYHKPTDKITYFSSENKIVYLHDQSAGKKYMTDFTLEELAAEHLDPDHFFRINRKYIVNIQAIELFKAYPGQRLILKLHEGQMDELLVSREKVVAFKEWFTK